MPTAPPQPSLDRPPAPLLQDPRPEPWAVLTGAFVGKGLPYRSRLRLRTLVAQRWLAIGGQTAAVLFAGFVLKYDLPFSSCFALIAL